MDCQYFHGQGSSLLVANYLTNEYSDTTNVTVKVAFWI